MTESQIQSKIIKHLEKNGYFVIKLMRTNINGVPDLLAIKDGTASFYEVKRENGVVSEMQKFRIKQLISFGCKAKVVKSIEDL
jgi:Holliday junction resolvase